MEQFMPLSLPGSPDKHYVEGNTFFPNPSIPLSFERYSDDSTVSECPELKSEIEHLVEKRYTSYRLEVNTFKLLSHDTESNKLKAHVAALEAYSADDPVAAANEALELCTVPDAYNVKAMFQSKDFEEAIDWYTRAANTAISIVKGGNQKGKNGWILNEINKRAFLRATHGTANCYRKLGLYAEAEMLYKYLQRADTRPMTAQMTSNWRFHILEVLMKQGKYQEANTLARSPEYKECYISRSYPAKVTFLWNLALLDFICNNKHDFDGKSFKMVQRCKYLVKEETGSFRDEDYEDFISCPIAYAVSLSPLVLHFLRCKVKLPYYSIPETISGISGESWTLAAEYARAYMPLWQKTEGAIDWAVKNSNTIYVAAMLVPKKGPDPGYLKWHNITNDDDTLKKLIDEGIFPNAKVPLFGDNQPLVHHAMVEGPYRRVRLLLDAGAKMEYDDPDIIDPVQYTVVCDFDPQSIKVFIEKGHDPYSSKYTSRRIGPYSSRAAEKFAAFCFTGEGRSAVMAAAYLGHARHLHVIFSLRAPDNDTCHDVLVALLQSPCGPCLNGGEKCSRCKTFGDEYETHYESASMALCISALLYTGYRPSQTTIQELKKVPTSSYRKLFMKALKDQLKLGKDKLLAKLENRYGKVLPSCAVCKSSKNLRKCGTCLDVYYCGSKCQKQDWKTHKVKCRKYTYKS